MEIKYLKSLKEYKYLIMFDLASKITGVCVFDLSRNCPLFTKVIKITSKEEPFVHELYNLIGSFFCELYEQHGIKLEDCVVSKEMPPSQAGRFTTIQTFMALAKSHAVLDLYCAERNVDVYDYVGVAPITAHCYFKKIMGLDSKSKVEKTDIRKYVSELYNISNLTLDESDAVFLAKTLIDLKWNNDLDEKIKELKRHKKGLKLSAAISKVDKEIEELQKYRRE